MSNISHIHTTIIDPKDGTRVALVPLSKGKTVAKVNEDDLFLLHQLGFTGRWFLNANGSGAEYVRLFHGDNNKNVANLIMDPPRGYVVRYRNGNRKDLRRSNLYLQSRKSLKKEIAHD